MSKNALYNGFDTLEFSTTDFYLGDSSLFSEMKVLAGEESDKRKTFSYIMKKGRYSNTKYNKNGEKETAYYDIQGIGTFTMKSKSFNPYSWTFHDIDNRYQFSMVWSETGKVFKKIFGIKVFSKTFQSMTFEEVKIDLQKKIKIFGINLERMKVKRIDWATDLKYSYKKSEWFLKQSKFLKRSNFSECFFSTLGSKKNPFEVVPYSKDYLDNGTLFNEGVSLGTKNIKLRIYDKVLECLVNYQDDREKNQMYLDKYYPIKQVVLSPCDDPTPSTNLELELNTFNDCLLRDYLVDRYQVLRFEYQLRAEYFDRKIKFVEDLTEKKVLGLVCKIFKNVMGIKEKYIDRDFKIYVSILEEGEPCLNIHELPTSTLYGRMINATRRLGSAISSLGICLTESKKRVVTFDECMNHMDYFKKFVEINYLEKIWEENKENFSKKSFEHRSVDFNYFVEELFSFQEVSICN